MFKRNLTENNKGTKRSKGLLALLMVGVMTIGVASAYFTDADTTTNTTTVGKISIDLQEPNWVDTEDVTPGQELAKDPKIVNDGVNEAYVFLKVEVPYANVKTAAQDGTVNAKADTELYAYDVNTGWVELTSYMVKDAAAKTVTHLYAYSANDKMTELNAGAETATLFDYVRFANVVEDEGLEETTQKINVSAYAIQTDNIGALTGTIDGDNADGTVVPSAVWDILIKQNPSTAK